MENGENGVCGRNDNFKDTVDNKYWSVAKSYGLPQKLVDMGLNIAIQGEFCGHGIQKNRLRLMQPKFYVFDIVNLDTNEYMNFNDLIECLRDEGYFQLDEILYAILQNNGTISVLNRSQYNPATPSDMNIDTSPSTLPLIIVNEGKVLKDNLALANIDTNFILCNTKASSLKEILFLTIDQEGKMYYQPTNKPFCTINTNHKGGNW